MEHEIVPTNRRSNRVLHPVGQGQASSSAATPSAAVDSASIRSRSPVPDEVPTHRAEQLSITKLIDDELGPHTSATVKKDVQKSTTTLIDKVRAVMKTQDRLEKIRNELTTLRTGELPKAVRKVPITFETELLEKVAVRTTSIAVDGIKTIRDCKESIHLQHCIAQRELDEQLLVLHLEKPKAAARKSTFLENRLAHFPSQNNPEGPKKSMDILGLIDSDNEESGGKVGHAGITKEQFKARLIAIYKKTIDKLADDRVREKTERGQE